MRREHFTVETDPDSDQQTLIVTFAGESAVLLERLEDGSSADETEFDVSYRRTPAEDDTDGILGVADRMTGEFIFETPVNPDLVQRIIEETRASDEEEDPRYTLRIELPDADPIVAEQTTLLVYNSDGSLNRKASLIPGSVEI